MDLFYPDDAHEICNDRTFISVSQMTAKRPKFGHGEENKLFSKFESKEALIEIITASCLVPFWAGYKPIKKGLNGHIKRLDCCLRTQT